ncbi:MAG TPA: hypothetical protein VK775_07875 [Chthoniobacterales bacterium]|jgi:hypothetical protein|nr:hypothetical protein [Chthoniobacterales bacterium]
MPLENTTCESKEELQPAAATGTASDDVTLERVIGFPEAPLWPKENPGYDPPAIQIVSPGATFPQEIPVSDQAFDQLEPFAEPTALGLTYQLEAFAELRKMPRTIAMEKKAAPKELGSRV